MKIIREIDGEEFCFELSPQELRAAFLELEHRNDVCDVESYFDNMKDEKIVSEFENTRNGVKRYYDDIAYEMRRLIEKYEMDWIYAREEAAREVLMRNAKNS